MTSIKACRDVGKKPGSNMIKVGLESESWMTTSWKKKKNNAIDGNFHDIQVTHELNLIMF